MWSALDETEFQSVHKNIAFKGKLRNPEDSLFAKFANIGTKFCIFFTLQLLAARYRRSQLRCELILSSVNYALAHGAAQSSDI